MDIQSNPQIEKMLSDLALIRSKTPNINNITNYVAMNVTANALLAIGAAPIMSQAIEEVDQMVALSSCLVLNIGTISVPWMESMIKAGEAAILKKVPIVFDPVGADTTDFRTIACSKIIDACSPNIICGKASEITSLANDDNDDKTVSDNKSTTPIGDIAKALAIKTKSVVVVYDTTSYITDGITMNSSSYGTDLMKKITGMGSVLSALIGAFASVNTSMIDAATHAVLLMGLTSQLAAKEAKGSGSLLVNFLDELCGFDEKAVERI